MRFGKFERTISAFAVAAMLTFGAFPQFNEPIPASADAAEIYKDNTIFSVPIPVVNCNGESVVLTGNLHFNATTVITGNNFSSTWEVNPQGISGTGTLGNTYHGNGVTRSTTNGSFINGQYNTTFVNNFLIVGQRGHRFTVHSLFHVTFNANGEVTASVSNFQFHCG